MTTIAEEMNMKAIARKTKMVALTVLLLAGLVLQSGCSTKQSGSSAASFRYDQAASPKAKPWTSENFKNDPYNFQFAILGDRGNGASPLGTHQRAIDEYI